MWENTGIMNFSSKPHEQEICDSLRRVKNLLWERIGNEENFCLQSIRNEFMRNGKEVALNESTFVPAPVLPGSDFHTISNKQWLIYRQKKKKSAADCDAKNFCVFCKNNGAPNYVYESHKLRDDIGRVICSHLRNYKCPICGGTGDGAHTVKYCPQKPIITLEQIQNHSVRRRNERQFQSYQRKNSHCGNVRC